MPPYHCWPRAGQTAPARAVGNRRRGRRPPLPRRSPAARIPLSWRRRAARKPNFQRRGRNTNWLSTYPKSPVKALPPTPPGLGSKVLYYTNNSAPAPPTPLDQNKAWQAVNKELNAEVSFTIIAQADYLAKLATVMAGNDLPDIMLIPGANASGAAQVQGLTQFLGGPVRRP